MSKESIICDFIQDGDKNNTEDEVWVCLANVHAPSMSE